MGSKKQIIIILALVSAVTFVFLYPVILNLRSCIPGFHSTDEPYGVIWSFWWLKFAHLNKIPDNFIKIIACPFGIKIDQVSFFPLWRFIAKYITIFLNEIFAYNCILLATFILSAVTMYSLVFFLTKSIGVSLFASLIYAFCPFHFVRVWQHFGTAQIQWMPLYILFLLKLWQNKKIKFAFFLGLCLALDYYFDIHYAYFMLIATSLFLSLIVFFSSYKIGTLRFIKLLFLSIATGTILFMPALLPFLTRLIESRQQSVSAYNLIRPFEDLFSQSAKPLSYFLPFTEHPLFGKFTQMFVGSRLWGESLTEHNMFLGFIPMLLTITAFVKRRALVSLMKSKGIDLSFNLKFFFSLILLAWLFSQPPWWDIFGFKIYMPSFLMYKILPMFRAYVRFGIVVMLGVSVLAAFGLEFILNKFKSQKIKIAIVFLACFFSLYEFWSNPREHVINLAKYPLVYDWLRDQEGDFIIAEYPLDTDGPNELYKFYQTKHGKRIINGTLPGTYAHKVARVIKSLSDTETVGVLKWMGVKYALVHRDDYLKTGLTQDKEELDKIPKNPWLRFVRSFSSLDCPEEDVICLQKTWPVDVYEVIESLAPIEPRIKKREVRK